MKEKLTIEERLTALEKFALGSSMSPEMTMTNERRFSTLKQKAPFIMPFGKCKGMSFSEIEEDDPNYLDWIEENMDNDRIQRELLAWRG